MSFDLQPVLSGPTLTMRPMAQDDWSETFALAADPQIWALHPMNDRWQQPVFRKYFDDGLASRGMLAAVDNVSGRIIGSSRYSTQFTEGPEEIEIGWTFLSRDHWGGASNREMKHLMLAHAFKGFETVIFRIGAENLRSRRAVEKIGGELLERRQVMKLGDREIVHVVYAIRRADFGGLLR